MYHGENEQTLWMAQPNLSSDIKKALIKKLTLICCKSCNKAIKLIMKQKFTKLYYTWVNKVNEHDYSWSRIKSSIPRQIAKYIYRIALPVNHIDIDQQYTGGTSKITAHWPKIEKIKLKLPRK